jgi:hypothetical protein
MSATFRIVPEENVEDSIFAMIRRLAESYKAVRVNRDSFSELHESVMQLEKFIGSLDQGQEHASAILEGITPETMSGLNEAYRFWEAQLDEHFAHRVVAGEACLSDYPLYDRVGDLVKRELALFSGAQPQRILLIGSGSFPITNSKHSNLRVLRSSFIVLFTVLLLCRFVRELMPFHKHFLCVQVLEGPLRSFRVAKI